jgi:uncharacterized protein YdeI (YjbR/CyaY-like superfamily)
MIKKSKPADPDLVLEGANRYAILFRIHTAKKPETRKARIEKFLGMLERGEKIHG